MEWVEPRSIKTSARLPQIVKIFAIIDDIASRSC